MAGKSDVIVVLGNSCLICDVAIFSLEDNDYLCGDHSGTGEVEELEKVCPPGLSAAQRRVFFVIKWKIENDGFSPTVREIADFLGLKGPATAYTHMKALRELNLVSWNNDQARTIRITEGR